jgi:hypothetical protein
MLRKEEKSRILDPVQTPDFAVSGGAITAKRGGAITPKGDTASLVFSRPMAAGNISLSSV